MQRSLKYFMGSGIEVTVEKGESKAMWVLSNLTGNHTLLYKVVNVILSQVATRTDCFYLATVQAVLTLLTLSPKNGKH